MALKICSFNCKGFNVSKVKHIENVLKQCDLLLLQETCALPRDVGKINQYFPEYNTFGVSTINDDVILAGRRTVVAHLCTENQYHLTITITITNSLLRQLSYSV